MKESIRKFTYYVILNLNYFRKDKTMQTAKRLLGSMVVREKTELIVKDDFNGSTIN